MSYQIETQSHEIQALVIAEPTAFTSLLVDTFAGMGVDCTVTPDHSKAPAEVDFRYTIVLGTPTFVAKSGLLKKSELTTISDRVVFVLTETDSVASHDKRVSRIISKVQNHAQESNQLLKILLLEDVYGPAFNSQPKSVVGNILSQFEEAEIKLPVSDNFKVYPLFETDAVDLISKAVFSRGTSGEVYRVGGPQTTALNFTYSARSVLRNHIRVTTSPDKSFQKKFQETTIEADLKALRFSPKVSPAKGLQKYFDHKPVQPTQSFTSETPTPPTLPPAPQTPVAPAPPSPTLPSANRPYQTVVVVDEKQKPAPEPEPELKQTTPEPTPQPEPEKSPPPTPKVAPTPLVAKPVQKVVEEVEHVADEVVDQVSDSVSQAAENFSALEKSAHKTFDLSKHRPKKKAGATQLKPTPTKKDKGWSAPVFSFSFKKPRFRKPNFGLTSTIVVLALVLVVTLLSPFVQLAYHGWKVKQITNQITDFSSMEVLIQEVDTITNLSQHSQEINRVFVDNKTLFKLVMGNQRYQHYLDLSTLLLHVVSVAEEGQSLLEQSISLSEIIFNKSEGDIEALLSDMAAPLSSMYHKLGLIEALLEKRSEWQDSEISLLQSASKTLSTQIPEVRTSFEKAQAMLKVVPTIIGLDDRATHLVLLQNNMELRPTGGFIGSYALVTFEEGHLIDLKVEDVYAADGQLKGYVEPPQPIEQYLGEASWFLRDSNWNPNFPTTAETAAWFLNKSMGTQVDGVIGINLYVVQELLRQMGPVELVDYDETITADNLYERAQYQSEINFFPGSTQKRDYLGHITRTLYLEILDSEPDTLFGVARTFVTAAKQGNLTIALDNSKAQEVISKVGWAGEILDPSCELETTPSCFEDYVAIREANVGVNKANYFVNRQVKDVVTLSRNEVEHNLELALENTSLDAVWPGGPYKNYVRFYIDPRSEFSQITINGQVVPQSEIRVERENGKVVVGTLVTVQPQGKSLVQLDYSIPYGLGSEPLTAYQNYYQKQPGTGADNYTLMLNYPEEFDVVESSTPFEQISENTLEVLETLDVDQKTVVEFIR